MYVTVRHRDVVYASILDTWNVLVPKTNFHKGGGIRGYLTGTCVTTTNERHRIRDNHTILTLMVMHRGSGIIEVEVLTIRQVKLQGEDPATKVEMTDADTTLKEMMEGGGRIGGVHTQQVTNRDGCYHL